MITNADFNAYILNYIKNDKTKSAVMLSGSWGTGKSYYIINSLIPFFEVGRKWFYRMSLCFVIWNK